MGLSSSSSSSKKSNLEMEKEGKEEMEGRERYEMGSRSPELPEECISKILSFTTAADACRSCSFNLERRSGKRCYMLGARELNITWGDNPSYWSWNTIPDSRFAEVAELQYVWWFDIIGRIETSILSPATNYAAYLVYKTTTNSYGFDSIPVKVWVRPVDELGHNESTNEIEANADGVFLMQRQQGRGLRGGGRQRLPRQREDGWMEAEMGEFYNDGQGNSGNYIEMRCREVLRNDRKSGLILLGIELRPKARQSYTQNLPFLRLFEGRTVKTMFK
ncbi:Phloem protein 2-like [Dillenia turbinata]|uniref:Phloem protein 2-like n=1 Tax=Dillenia turbinata TaxID=194707 RepID=A0AAN8UM00_9MAGN